MPRLLVDTAILAGETGSLPLHWLEGFELLPFAPRGLTGATPGVREADALLVRTMTRVDADLLAGMPRLRALATLSSGTDHLDEQSLKLQNISLHTGHGGNARPVADWVEWALTRLGHRLRGDRALVVGVGAVGTLVAARLQQMGLIPLLCDPPRAEQEPDFPHVDLDQALQQNLATVTLHVPKIMEGPHRTQNLLNRQRLAQIPGLVVLNAARGGVLEEQAVLDLHQTQALVLALDTFVGEPHPQQNLLHIADLATPHIGGHSIEGKLRVAHLALTGLRAALGMEPPPPLETAIAQATNAPNLEPFAQLDRADQMLRHEPQAFESIRHMHRRQELALR